MLLTVYCPECYAANNERDAVCGRCGAALNSDPRGDYADRLIWALNHPEPTVAPRAAWILGRRRDAKAVAPLIAVLESRKDMGVQEAAVVALGQIGDPRALPVLQKLLLDEESYLSVRERAAWALGRIGDPSASAALREAVLDRSPAVRAAAAAALNLLTGQRVEPR